MSILEAFSTGRTHVPEGEILLRFFLAIVLGGAIGFERELRERSAGLRTHMLTSLAAAVFTVLTFEIFHATRDLVEGANADPIRLIEAVTAGVSFLAAGTIIHGSGKIHGLTTGAGIWLAGAIGTACGAGYFLIAFLAMVLAIGIVVLLRQFERKILDTKSEDESKRGPAR